MFIPREIAQNILMGFVPVRRWAQRRHSTGIQSDPVRSKVLFERFAGLVGAALAQARILELGPGRGLGLMREAQGRCRSYAAFDGERYLTDREVTALGVDYRVDPRGLLPWGPDSFDVVWSHSVLEHVRQPGEILDDVHRVLSRDGLLLADIDLEDHYGSRKSATLVYGFLQYPEWLWSMMTRNRSSYCNRLRRSDWLDLVEAHSFCVACETRKPPAVELAQLRKVPYLERFSDDDLMAAQLILVMKKQAPGGGGNRCP
jgi:SAM-dependent methyltransferase